ncbi:putative ribonuclease H-like domain-containing protein, partial [Tanacetum coccineum]
NGNAPIVTKTVDGKETVIPPISVEEKAPRRTELKAISTLLMALPNEHQLKLNSYKEFKIHSSGINKCLWDTVKAKTVNGKVQLQALVDKKKVIITESTIRRDLQLEDAEGTECLPTATIFEELTRMGYEKLTQKLTFYKAFFSPQWKFLIHTILQCLSTKTIVWNEFSSTMASVIICLATNQKFNFFKYILDNMVKNVDSMVKFWMYLRFIQKREGKGFSRTITPLFQTMMVQSGNNGVKVQLILLIPITQPTITQPSTSQQLKKKQPRRKQRRDTGSKVVKVSQLVYTEPMADETATKYPIVDWETQILANDKYYYQIKRADGNVKHYKIFSAMLYDFDRQDVLELYRLVKERFQTASPEGYDLLLWGDMKTLIKPNKEDEIWRNQQDWNLINWKLHIFVEFIRLEVDYQSEMGNELIRELWRQKQVLAVFGIGREVVVKKRYTSWFVTRDEVEDDLRVSVPQTAQENGTSVTKMLVPVTAEEKTNKKNDVKAKACYSWALPNNITYFTSVQYAKNNDCCYRKTDLELGNICFSDNVVYAFIIENPNGSNLLQQDLEQIHEDDLEAMDLKWQLSLLSMRAKRYYQRTGKKIFINANDTLDVEHQGTRGSKFRNQDNTRKHGNNEDTSSKAMLAIDGVDFDWCDMAEEKITRSTIDQAYNDLQQDDTGFVDSGCSRHMTRNIAYLLDFKEFDGDYVTFGGGAHGGRIFGKGTLKTNSLDFEDVYFVNDLKFNLFSVSQMCDKKNYVLFTDTECLVLSPNFKLPNETQILIKIPRKDNMYSFDMKNIVPKKSLTCLVAKATSDELMLWHKRLGHINFKNINKLVKDNLVRELRTKCFENDQTCVACLKGKQHRASCKSKVLNPITKPLFMLHMDLFGPTFVSSLMHKKYCLVVTDDYSRFTWVFFLTTKDETSEILKNFIKEIENLVDKKVKIIRCDNGTEFKNKFIDDFCREKGIKREYSVARTPQQNGVAERSNRTLIEAARTMLADSKLPTTFWAKA